MPTYSLYFYPSCYYCRLVLQAIDAKGLDVELRDIHQNPKWREELAAARGRTTVPVLRIDTDEQSQWMPESRDIVKFISSL